MIVASRSLPASDDASPGGVEVTGEGVARLFDRLAADGIERVYVDGGRLISSCLEAGLIDELIITRVPVVLGGARRSPTNALRVRSPYRPARADGRPGRAAR